MTPYLIAAGITIGAVLCGIGIAWLLGHPTVPEGHWTDGDIVRVDRTGEVLQVSAKEPVLTAEQQFVVSLAEIGYEVERGVFADPPPWKVGIVDIGFAPSAPRTFVSDMRRFLDRIVKHGR